MPIVWKTEPYSTHILRVEAVDVTPFNVEVTGKPQRGAAGAR